MPRLHHVQRALEHPRELRRIRDRSLGPHAVALRELGVVDVGIVDGSADVRAIDAALAPIGFGVSTLRGAEHHAQ